MELLTVFKGVRRYPEVRGAFGKFLARSVISVTDLQTLLCLVSF